MPDSRSQRAPDSVDSYESSHGSRRNSLAMSKASMDSDGDSVRDASRERVREYLSQLPTSNPRSRSRSQEPPQYLSDRVEDQNNRPFVSRPLERPCPPVSNARFFERFNSFRSNRSHHNGSESSRRSSTHLESVGQPHFVSTSSYLDQYGNPIPIIDGRVQSSPAALDLRSSQRQIPRSGSRDRSRVHFLDQNQNQCPTQGDTLDQPNVHHSRPRSQSCGRTSLHHEESSQGQQGDSRRRGRTSSRYENELKMGDTPRRRAESVNGVSVNRFFASQKDYAYREPARGARDESRRHERPSSRYDNNYSLNVNPLPHNFIPRNTALRPQNRATLSGSHIGNYHSGSIRPSPKQLYNVDISDRMSIPPGKDLRIWRPKHTEKVTIQPQKTPRTPRSSHEINPPTQGLNTQAKQKQNTNISLSDIPIPPDTFQLHYKTHNEELQAEGALKGSLNFQTHMNKPAELNLTNGPGAQQQNHRLQNQAFRRRNQDRQVLNRSSSSSSSSRAKRSRTMSTGEFILTALGPAR